MRRRGFSATDLLILIAVAAIIIALLIPAHAKARGAARRTQSQNNLKMLGLALHNYHDVYRTFPPGIVAMGPTAEYLVTPTTAPASQTQASSSGLTSILPFMEEAEAYNRYNFHMASFSVQNATAVSHPVATFVSPDNPRKMQPLPRGVYQVAPGSTVPGPAPTDYVFCVGATGILMGNDNPLMIVQGAFTRYYPAVHRMAAGMFYVNSGVRIDTVRDGVSNTFMMGESVGGPQLKMGANAAGKAAAGGENLAKADPEFFCDQAWSQSFIGTRDGKAGFGSVFGTAAFNAYYDTNRNLVDPAKWKVLPPNEAGLKMGRPTWYDRSNPKFDVYSPKPVSGDFGVVQGFRGYSAGGVNMLFGDGSVRLIANNIDARTWAAMSTVAGREPIEGDQ